MRKTLHLFGLVILLFIFFGRGNSNAQEVKDILTWKGLGLSEKTNGYASFTKRTFSSTAEYRGNASSNYGKCIQLRAGTSKNSSTHSGIVTVKSGGNVRKVSFMFSSNEDSKNVDVYGKTTAYTNANDLYSNSTQGERIATVQVGSSTSVEVSVNGNYSYIGIRSTKGAIYISQIAIVWENENSTGKTATKLAFEKGSYTLLQDTNASDLATYTNVASVTDANGNAVSDATVTYASSNKEHVDVNENGEVTIEQTVAGTYTITATYAGDDTYAKAEASYTISVEPVYQNIAALKAAYSSTGITGALKLDHAQVTYVDGNSKYLQDASGAVCVYGGNVFTDYKAGDVLNGHATVTYNPYNGLPEITVFKAINEINVTSGDAPRPQVMTIEEAQKDENLCRYVVIKNVMVTPGTKVGNATAKDNSDNEITVYKKNQTFATGQYDLTGVVSIHNSAKQIAFISYAPDFTLAEDAESNTITAGENATVTIGRTFNANAWNTLVLPFGLTEEQVKTTFGSDVKLAKYVGTDKVNGAYTLRFEPTATIEANVPVFIYGANDEGIYEVTGVTTVAATPTDDLAGADFNFIGTYDKVSVTAGDWFVSSDNNFYRAQGTEAIKPMRAVFRAVSTAAGAKSLNFCIEGGTPTGISSISADGIELGGNAPRYNLAGQRVSKYYKGIVIMNGKKILNK